MSYPCWWSLAKSVPQHTEWVVVEVIFGDPLKPAWYPARKIYPSDDIGISEGEGFMTDTEVIAWIKKQPLTDTFKHVSREAYLERHKS